MDTTAATMHPAEAYLRNEQNPPVLYVRIYGERRKLFINRGGENVIGIIAKGKRKHGYIFSDWSHIEKIYYPSQEKVDEKDMDRKMILKYQKLVTVRFGASRGKTVTWLPDSARSTGIAATAITICLSMTSS